MYPALREEMNIHNVSIQSVADLIGVHRNSIYNKLYKEQRFEIDEAMLIRDEFFKEMKLEDLFKRPST